MEKANLLNIYNEFEKYFKYDSTDDKLCVETYDIMDDYRKLSEKIIDNYKNCVFVGVGDYLKLMHLDNFEYKNKCFLNVGGDAVLVDKGTTIEQYIKERGW